VRPLAIDAHAHVFLQGLKLAGERRYTPNYDAPLERYLKHLDQHGLSHGILVQPSFLGTDNSYLVESLAQAGDRLRGIAVVDLAVSRHELLRLAQAGVVGIRLNLLGQPLPDLGARPWRVLLDMVATLGWHVEIQRDASGLADLFPQLLDAGVPVIIDHFGLPDPRSGTADPAFQQLLKLGKSQKVWVKISASYRNGVDGERLAWQLFPRLREKFGLQRLMWGSDWPHTQFENEQTYENSRMFLTVLAGDDETVAEILAAPRELFHL
jgi:predicted TIM-barrel fold metal-dependent hydrolase